MRCEELELLLLLLEQLLLRHKLVHQLLHLVELRLCVQEAAARITTAACTATPKRTRGRRREEGLVTRLLWLKWLLMQGQNGMARRRMGRRELTLHRCMRMRLLLELLQLLQLLLVLLLQLCKLHLLRARLLLWLFRGRRCRR